MSKTFYRQVSQLDRIVIMGDAMALSGNRTHGFITLLRDAVDQADLTWWPVGRTGDRWEHAGDRFRDEVASLRPSVLMVMLGLNDVWHQSRGHVLEFGKTRQAIHDLAVEFFKSQPTGDLLLCPPLLIGEKTDGTNSLDRDLESLSQVVTEVADEIAVGLQSGQVAAADGEQGGGPTVSVLNLRRLALEYLQQHNSLQKPHSVLTVDGIQLNRCGHQFLATVLADFFAVQLPLPKEEWLRHVVFLQFKSQTGVAKTREVLQAFQALGQKIEVIAAIESGVNNSPEGLADGFTHCFTLTFRSATDRDIYLNHPLHQEFVQLALPALERVCVLDYWAQPHATVN